MTLFVPQPPLRDPTQDQLVQRMLQGAIPDRVNTDPMVEVKFISQCPSGYGRVVATSLRANVSKREQQLYQEYLTRLKLRLKDRDPLDTPDGTVHGRPPWSLDSQAPPIRLRAIHG